MQTCFPEGLHPTRRTHGAAAAHDAHPRAAEEPRADTELDGRGEHAEGDVNHVEPGDATDGSCGGAEARRRHGNGEHGDRKDE